MGELYRIVVPWDPARASLNRRLHWRARHEVNQAAKRAAYHAWLNAGAPRVRDGLPVRVSIVVRRGRVMDLDNALTGLKGCLDALFTGDRITPDDGPKCLELGGLRLETGKQWRDRPEVLFVVETAGE